MLFGGSFMWRILVLYLIFGKVLFDVIFSVALLLKPSHLDGLLFDVIILCGGILYKID